MWLNALRLDLFEVWFIPRESQVKMWHLISVGSLWPVHSGRVGPSALVRIAGKGGGEKETEEASR